MLRVYHRLGVRMVGLVHSLRNLLADGVADNRTKGGLSQFGVEVVEELDKLGMIVDVSHLSDASFWDVLEISKDPVVASHSNARAVCNHPRNMTDDMIRALADRGGVMGMNFATDFVHPKNPSVETLVDHIVDLVGSEHVARAAMMRLTRARETGLLMGNVRLMPNRRSITPISSRALTASGSERKLKGGA